MNLAAISLMIFFIVKMIYGYWGDYASTYWAVVYYIALYFMITSVMNYMRELAITRIQRQLFTLGMIYFGVLLIMNAVCLINIDWYMPLLATGGKITTTLGVLVIGLIVINYFRIKSHDPKN